MGFEDRQYYRDDHQSRRALPGFQFNQQSVVLSLIVINVVIFFLDAFTPTRPDNTHWLSHFMAISALNPLYVWTYLTHGFAHSSMGADPGFMHIVGNMVTLWFLGRYVEQRLGRSEFLKFYLVSIVVAGVGWELMRLVFYPGQPSFIVGASGAVSAVVVVFIFMYPREQIMLMGILPMPAWAVGVLMMVMNLYYSLDPESHIAWEAHLVGALFGLMYFKLGWNFDRLKFGGLSKVFGPRSKLRVHKPDESDEKLQSEADEILAKISEHGEESLTRKEQKKLKKYSEQLRKNRDN